MQYKIAVIGLGYVGLPLAVEFAKQYDTIGFDIAQWRIDELNSGYDRTLEVTKEALVDVVKTKQLSFSNNLADIAMCNIYIVTVPTPVDKHKKPDLSPLLKATESVAKVLKKDDIVIYESTVYPGATEEECVPILEKISGLRYISSDDNSTFNIKNSILKTEGFYCGYSPERINPGDKEHTVTKILKVTSGSTPESAEKIDALYKSIITAGTHLAPSIKVAEAAKVIENSQRDINIAFVNELAMIFNKLDIDTDAVLEAAGTKWNFLPFKPGLVGGHCIGVDPYYLTYKAQQVGYNPEIILAGRRLNDNMGSYVANQVVKLMIKKGKQIAGDRVLVLGLTFKENCPDIRNTRVVDLIQEMQEFGAVVDVYDPWADPKEVEREYKIALTPKEDLDMQSYDAVILAVAHKLFLEEKVCKDIDRSSCVLYDIKSVLENSDGKL